MFKQATFVAFFGVIVAGVSILALRRGLPIGPVVAVVGLVPLAGLVIAGRPLKSALPDLLFGSIDTGLLVIPALWGGMAFGVVGAIAGGIIGDSLTDGIAGFFEGGIAKWLRKKGIEESRDPVTTSLGKMAGCLLGSGLVLLLALAAGIRPRIN